MLPSIEILEGSLKLLLEKLAKISKPRKSLKSNPVLGAVYSRYSLEDRQIVHSSSEADPDHVKLSIRCTAYINEFQVS